MAEQATTSVEGEMSTTDTTEMVTPTETGEMSGTETTEETSQSQPSADDLNKELERVRTALKKANKEATQSRNAEKELKELKERIDTEKLSDQEKVDVARKKLEQQYTELQAEHEATKRASQQYRINTEVKLQAAQLGFSDPGDAVRFLEASEIEQDESGNPTNIDDLLKTLAKNKPYLVTRKPAPTSSGATNPSRSQSSAVGQLSWDVIGKMTPVEYNSRHSEIVQWMAQNPIRR